jgi:hypothetical protein
MRTRYLLLGMILLLPLQACGGHVPSGGAVGEDPVVRSAVSVMRSGTTTRLQILYLPKEITTIVRVDLDALERLCYYRIGIERFHDSKLRSDLISALENSSVQRTREEADLRWGCVFYDAKDTRVLTIYFDRWGRNGLINGIAVTSNGRYVDVLEQKCSGLWAGQYEQ